MKWISVSLDDLAAVYRWLKAHAGRLVVLFTMFEKVLNLSFVRAMLSWLNPRKHTWNFILLMAIVMGVGLALAEALGEGASNQIGRFALVTALFISLEAAGVLLGYALLGKPLGLFRKDSEQLPQFTP